MLMVFNVKPRNTLKFVLTFPVLKHLSFTSPLKLCQGTKITLDVNQDLRTARSHLRLSLLVMGFAAKNILPILKLIK